MTTTPTPWRTVEDAAARGLVSKKTIYKEVKAKRLRAATVGGRKNLRFLDEWVDEWLVNSAPKEINK
jgi:excisionase family DNA binding protein